MMKDIIALTKREERKEKMKNKENKREVER